MNLFVGMRNFLRRITTPRYIVTIYHHPERDEPLEEWSTSSEERFFFSPVEGYVHIATFRGSSKRVLRLRRWWAKRRMLPLVSSKIPLNKGVDMRGIEEDVEQIYGL